MFNPTSNPYKFKYLITGITGDGIEQVYLPPQPPDEEILFKEEQKFTRPEPYEQLKIWMEELVEERAEHPDYIHAHQAEINEWEEQEFERCTNGIWFWNDGVPTYITGPHYKYLTQWQVYFGRPDYRETDKETFYWIAFWEEDPNSFGGAYNTCRREGKSTKMGYWITNRTSTNFNHLSGMQGEDNTKIQDFYNNFVIDPFYNLPYYSQPEYDTTTLQKKGIIFKEPPRRNKKRVKGKKTVLNSKMDYRTSEANKYDQAALYSYVGEEFGKCHPAGTMVRMFNGTLKSVENVVTGDILMGDDSTPRVVLNTGKGFGKIFKITANGRGKAEPWYVNEDHILSCKISFPGTIGLFKGMKKGDVINIPIKEYLNLTKKTKQHLMCYRVALEYPARQHNIDPYFLGIWLGDGSSTHVEITNTDFEIIDWLKNYCKKNQLNFHQKKGKNAITYSITNGRFGIRHVFRQKHLFDNKHIPKDYLIDSRENRLKLLAGLIDTDGYKNPDPKKRHYEIIQKNKTLAFQIQELCLSLGFYASCREKTATMRRSDGTLYSCPVYRIAIYGKNLHEIPCLIERKKMNYKGTEHNAKDPSIYGFTVSYDREDWYYGFNISGNRLYVLKDYTVTHNTLMCSVWDRWKFVKPALKDGIMIRGKAFIGTTVEYMDVTNKGGKAYRKLCYASDYNIRTGNNQTLSGLYAALMPSDCVLKGFIDEHGRPIRDKARAHILREREALRGNPKDYSDEVRKYPLDWNEVFYVSADRCMFNATILQDQKKFLQFNPNLIRRCDLRWENNIRFSRVVRNDNPTNGWCKFAWLPKTDEEMALLNAVEERTEFDHETGQPRRFFAPKNDGKLACGTDPIDHGVVIELDQIDEDDFTSTRRSKPVVFVKSKYDSAIDGSVTHQEILEQRRDTRFPYKTNRYLVMMDTRPMDPNVYFERALMICWYLGVSIHCEAQKPGLMNWFNAAGCGDFVWQKYIPNEGQAPKKSDMTDGTPASTMMIQEYTGSIATYVEYFGHTIPFIELVDDLLVAQSNKTKEHDYYSGMGWTELAGKMKPRRVQLPTRQVTEFMPLYDRFGNIVK